MPAGPQPSERSDARLAAGRPEAAGPGWRVSDDASSTAGWAVNGVPVEGEGGGRRWMVERAKELAGRTVELRRRAQAAGADLAERARLQAERERCEVEMDELVQAFKVRPGLRAAGRAPASALGMTCASALGIRAPGTRRRRRRR